MLDGLTFRSSFLSFLLSSSCFSYYFSIIIDDPYCIVINKGSTVGVAVI